jgi:hypothetical protein
MQNVITLSVFMLSVAAPIWCREEKVYIIETGNNLL